MNKKVTIITVSVLLAIALFFGGNYYIKEKTLEKMCFTEITFTKNTSDVFMKVIFKAMAEKTGQPFQEETTDYNAFNTILTDYSDDNPKEFAEFAKAYKNLFTICVSNVQQITSGNGMITGSDNNPTTAAQIVDEKRSLCLKRLGVSSEEYQEHMNKFKTKLDQKYKKENK